MNAYLATAGVLVLVVGLVHSVLGEVLIFRRLRTHGVLPSHGGNVIGAAHVRIIWASWHIVTVLGWLIGAVLLWLSARPTDAAPGFPLLPAIAMAMLVSAALVLVATRARHPGWAGLLAAALLIWLGRAA